jgi:hypothetical protein
MIRALRTWLVVVGALFAVLVSGAPAHAAVHFWGPRPARLPAYWNCGTAGGGTGWAVYGCTRLSPDSAGRTVYIPTIVVENNVANGRHVDLATTDLVWSRPDGQHGIIQLGQCAETDFSRFASAACHGTGVYVNRFGNPGGLCANVYARVVLLLPGESMTAVGKTVAACP